MSKRPGRTARLERVRRAKERAYRRRVKVVIPLGRRRWDEFPGKIVAIGIPPEVVV